MVQFENKAIFVLREAILTLCFFIPLKSKTIKIKPYFNGVIKTNQHVPRHEIPSSEFENQNVECLSLGELVKLPADGSWLGLNRVAQ